MAAWKREVIGSVLSDKNDKTKSYIKIENDVTLKKGDYLNLESKQNQIDGITGAFKAGKVNEEILESALERIAKMPDFVRFNIVKLTKTE